MAEHVRMPDTLRVWLRSKDRASQVARILHVPEALTFRWVLGEHLEQWRVNQVRAVMELGLIGGNGNGRARAH